MKDPSEKVSNDHENKQSAPSTATSTINNLLPATVSSDEEPHKKHKQNNKKQLPKRHMSDIVTTTTAASTPMSGNSVSLAQLASAELEDLRQQEQTSPTNNKSPKQSLLHQQHFPVACYRLVQSLPGNSTCVDCGALHPQWASVSFGIVLCLECAGHHRSLGVAVSTVKSLTMDHWSVGQILHMLEGGNGQLTQFFQRHALHKGNDQFHSSRLTSDNVHQMRYKTKAGLFYSQQLEHHVQQNIVFPYQPKRRKATTKASAASSSSSSTPPTDMAIESKEWV